MRRKNKRKRKVVVVVVLALLAVLIVQQAEPVVEAQSAPVPVFIESQYDFEGDLRMYVGEDTRGNRYVIRGDNYDLKLKADQIKFVRISLRSDEWYITEVLPDPVMS